MSKDLKFLLDDKNHFQDCHRRWLTKINRDIGSENYKDEWCDEQCFDCKYFVPLTGVFCDDYGACTNAESKFDKHVMFEHDGCENHVLDENYYSN